MRPQYPPAAEQRPSPAPAVCAEPRAANRAWAPERTPEKRRAIFSSAPDMDPRLRAPALKGDVEALTTALKAGADPNLRDDDGYAPFCLRRFKWACALY